MKQVLAIVRGENKIEFSDKFEGLFYDEFEKEFKKNFKKEVIVFDNFIENQLIIVHIKKINIFIFKTLHIQEDIRDYTKEILEISNRKTKNNFNFYINEE